MNKLAVLFVVAALLACSPSGAAMAREAPDGERLLEAAEGLQIPSSEADSTWQLFSHTGVDGLPAAEAFGEMSGCPRGGTTRFDFEETLARLGEVEPRMDAGQARSAHGFRKLERVFEREVGEELAVYRCDVGEPEVKIYFAGTNGDRLLGLMTVSIET